MRHKLDAMTDDLVKRVAALEARAKERTRSRSTSDGEGETVESGEAKPGRTKTAHTHRGRPKRLVIDGAQMNLLEQERQGRFVKVPIVPESEFPTLLTRLPIFRPGKRSKQRALIDKDYAINIETSWGALRKHGPPLSVYDEDTLYALFRLRTDKLIAPPQNLPIPVPGFSQSMANDKVEVHITQCMLSDIQDFCERSNGGRNVELRFDSIKRLAATTLEVSQKGKNKFVRKGAVLKLIDVAWQDYEENAILFVQLPPYVAYWLEKEYTYINWDIRKELTDTGKAVHRFLAGQPRVYEIGALKLKNVIGYMRTNMAFIADLKKILAQLQSLGWISQWKVTGTGRKTPHMVFIERR